MLHIFIWQIGPYFCFFRHIMQKTINWALWGLFNPPNSKNSSSFEIAMKRRSKIKKWRILHFLICMFSLSPFVGKHLANEAITMVHVLKKEKLCPDWGACAQSMQFSFIIHRAHKSLFIQSSRRSQWKNVLFAAYLCSLNTIGGLLEVVGDFSMIYYLRGHITGARCFWSI